MVYLGGTTELGGANNPYIMPILHFIRQSVRVGAEELENMLVSMGLQVPAYIFLGARTDLAQKGSHEA